ncbi:transcriptional regulator, XRE family [Desulforamulus reducens MI-1]|uniref:Transcriptional regulator, XRE family n=2 Tax=Desulforamulus TaxID=2916693 RepID=A4J892_DESRM|nr:transcriptional regulator, XRE family [Desulforamulus reducens MI-1]
MFLVGYNAGCVLFLVDVFLRSFVMSTIGERLRQLRKEKNINREDVANLLGVTVRSVTNYESGQRNLDPDQLIALADYYDVSMDYLTGRSDNPKPPQTTTIDDEWPEVANVLRRNGKKLTTEDKKRIATIIKAAVEDIDE